MCDLQPPPTSRCYKTTPGPDKIPSESEWEEIKERWKKGQEKEAKSIRISSDECFHSLIKYNFKLRINAPEFAADFKTNDIRRLSTTHGRVEWLHWQELSNITFNISDEADSLVYLSLYPESERCHISHCNNCNLILRVQ